MKLIVFLLSHVNGTFVVIERVCKINLPQGTKACDVEQIPLQTVLFRPITARKEMNNPSHENNDL